MIYFKGEEKRISISFSFHILKIIFHFEMRDESEGEEEEGSCLLEWHGDDANQK